MGMIKKENEQENMIYLFITLYTPVVLLSYHASKIELFEKWSVAAPLSS